MSRTRIPIPFTAAVGGQPLSAIPIESLPDLEAATKWLTNSDSLWQGVSNLLNIFPIPLFSHVNQEALLLNRYVNKEPQAIHRTHQSFVSKSACGIY
jgi:hypothetical protein